MSSNALAARAFLLTRSPIVNYFALHESTRVSAAILGHCRHRINIHKGVTGQSSCFSRPWTKWSYDQTLDSIKAAGYHLTGLLTRTKDDPFIASDATPEYLETLKKKIVARGLESQHGRSRSRHSIPLEDSIRDVHVQIDNARFLGLEYLLTFGVDDASQQDHYFRVMALRLSTLRRKG